MMSATQYHPHVTFIQTMQEPDDRSKFYNRTFRSTTSLRFTFRERLKILFGKDVKISTRVLAEGPIGHAITDEVSAHLI